MVCPPPAVADGKLYPVWNCAGPYPTGPFDANGWPCASVATSEWQRASFGSCVPQTKRLKTSARGGRFGGAADAVADPTKVVTRMNSDAALATRDIGGLLWLCERPSHCRGGRRARQSLGRVGLGPAAPRRDVLRLRAGEEIRIAAIPLHEPVDERVAVLRRAELRDVDEFGTRLLGDVVDTAHAQHVERVHAARPVETPVHLEDHFLLAVRVRLIRIDLPVQWRVRVGRQPDQRRPTLLVALRRLDDRDLRAIRRVHHMPDVRDPLPARRLQLAQDEVADVVAVRRFVQSSMKEV